MDKVTEIQIWPIDVLLAAGLNNFKTDTPDQIMEKIRAFKETVVRRADGSTFAILHTALRPPPC